MAGAFVSLSFLSLRLLLPLPGGLSFRPCLQGPRRSFCQTASSFIGTFSLFCCFNFNVCSISIPFPYSIPFPFHSRFICVSVQWATPLKRVHYRRARYLLLLYRYLVTLAQQESPHPFFDPNSMFPSCHGSISCIQSPIDFLHVPLHSDSGAVSFNTPKTLFPLSDAPLEACVGQFRNAFESFLFLDFWRFILIVHVVSWACR